jgi:hypothetical protein
MSMGCRLASPCSPVGREAREAPGLAGIGILKALTLADGVVGKNDKTIAREECGGAVVAGLAGRAVAGTHQNRRTLAARGWAVGKVEQRGHGKSGLAVEENLPDLKAVGLRGAEDSGVQRRALRQSADQRQDLFADHDLTLFGLGAGADGGYAGGARSGESGGDAVQRACELGAAHLRGTIRVEPGIGCGIWARWRRGTLSHSEACKQRAGEDYAKKRGDDFEHHTALILFDG